MLDGSEQRITGDNMSRKNTREVTTLWHEEVDGEEIEYEVTAHFHPGSPGRTSGPPDKCYPAEPAEIEIISVWNCTESKDEPELVDSFGENEDLYLDLVEKAEEEDRDDYEAAMEARADREREDRGERDW